MSRTNTQGQSYPLLDQVNDDSTRQVLRMLMDQVNALRQPSATQDLGGNTISGVSTPTEPDHVAPKGYVDTAVGSVRASLLGAGSNPLDLTGLRGQASQVQRAKLRILPAGDAFPIVGQNEELLYSKTTTKLYYFDSATSSWIVL